MMMKQLIIVNTSQHFAGPAGAEFCFNYLLYVLSFLECCGKIFTVFFSFLLSNDNIHLLGYKKVQYIYSTDIKKFNKYPKK